ncbi:MAG: DUF362 domain-containing protein [Promethearchaeota archaeon]
MNPTKPQVYVLKTSPDTVIDDYAKLMHLAKYQEHFPKDQKTVVKLNLSWSKFFPACSSPPWQVEGVLKTLIDDGYDPKKIFAAENRTVVTNLAKGVQQNRWSGIIKKMGVWFMPLTRVKFVPYESLRPKFVDLKKRLLHVLDSKVFPDGFNIPLVYLHKNMIHTPTMKTHGHTGAEGGKLRNADNEMKNGGITASMKNAFGGLLTKRRHFSHQFMSEVLVDLLIVQKQIHPNIMAVVDGTVCGDGAGPRTMIPRIKNHILAGYDQVAVDAVIAKLLGFDPLKLPAIKMAHDEGLGCGDFDQIELIGEEVSNTNWNFSVKRSFVIWGDQMVRKGPLSFLHPLFHNKLFMALPILASTIWHDMVWYPTIGRRRVKKFMETKWGSVFKKYPPTKPKILNKFN